MASDRRKLRKIHNNDGDHIFFNNVMKMKMKLRKVNVKKTKLK